MGGTSRVQAGARKQARQMAETMRIRVFSVDDHPLMHEGLATVIKNQPDMLLVAEASNGRRRCSAFGSTRPTLP